MSSFLQIRRRDLVVLMVATAAGLALLGYARWDIASKRAALQEEAQTHRAEFFSTSQESEYEDILETECGKSMGVLGKDWGVIRLYTRQKGDASMKSFMGVEYFYKYETSKWVLTDTARIDLPEYILEGYGKFEDAGYAVDGKAYLNFSR
ncbi:MAG: hypothetical protein IT365_17715 [Candidatus Hydrogenedentes bacterium]|nr:hypothetical protein [Candidatus Hydrogenedentota bacterium]